MIAGYSREENQAEDDDGEGEAEACEAGRSGLHDCPQLSDYSISLSKL